MVEADFQRVLTEGLVIVSDAVQAEALSNRLEDAGTANHWGRVCTGENKGKYEVEICQGSHCHCRY